MLARVSKPGLGRGLGKLLALPSGASNGSPATTTETHETQETLPSRSVSPGLKALLRAGREVRDSADETLAHDPSPAKRDQAQKHHGLRYALVIADLLLAALALAIAWKSRGRLSGLELALLAMAVSVGAWLSCLAILHRNQ